MAGEYLLKRTDGEWFDIGPKNFEQTLVPTSMPWHRVDGWGDFRIEVRDCPISFSYEDSGIQVAFEGSAITPDEELKLLNEMLANIHVITGQTGEIIPI